ncbi:MAG: HEAT repeat domain-containing protein [Pirellulaceae bacterium]
MLCDTKQRSLRVVWTIILACGMTPGQAAAQVEPADAAGEAGPSPPAAGIAAPGDTDPESPEPKPVAPEAPPETDPFVLGILAVKPTTPEQWLQDIRALIELNRPQLAKEYLASFSESLPPAAELAKLQARFGSALFMQLSSLESLQPEGGNVAKAVMQAADAQRRDGQRLTDLVNRLGDPQAGVRRLATADLVQAGPLAVPILIQALADPTRAGIQSAVIRTLQAIGSSAVDPLIVTLEARDPNLVVAAMRVLGSLKARKAIPFLMAPAWAEDSDAAVREAAGKALEEIVGSIPTQHESSVFLTQQLDSSLAVAGTIPGTVDEQSQVTLWVWDAEQQIPIERTLPVADASLLNAARIARQLYRVAPAQENHRILDLTMSLEVVKRQEGYDRPVTVPGMPVPAEAAQAGPAILEKVLEMAVARKLYGAAIAATDLLGETGDVSLVQSTDGQPRLLTKALLNPHRRVQFAAARAIMKLDPQSTFAGSSHLPEVLGYLSTSGGRRRVLIGDPRAQVARTLAGYFDELGFDVDTELAGRELVLRAFDSPDYVFVLLGDAIDRPAYRELVQILRNDPRTADLPIGILARDLNQQSAQQLAESDPLTLAFPPPQTREDVAVDSQRILQAAGRRLVSADERAREASFALDALATLAADSEKYGFYDLLRLEPRMRQALTIPTLATQAARVLGLLGTPRAQQTLIEFASAQVPPLTDRQAAADAFRTAVGRRGLLLTRDQLQKQYELYNASENLDRGTQEVLAALLDTIEAPTRLTVPSTKEN